VASGVELDLLRRVQALEQQVQQLSTTQRDETLQPTYLTINPATGAVGALFTGGIQIPAGQQLAWLNALGATVANITSGYVYSKPSTLTISFQPDSTDVATIQMDANPGGGNTSISVSAIDTIRGIQQQATVLASDGSSSFLQLPSETKLAVQAGSVVAACTAGVNSITATLPITWGTHVAFVAGAVPTSFATAADFLMQSGVNTPSQGFLRINSSAPQNWNVYWVSLGHS
jgi:hypothetical protein